MHLYNKRYVGKRVLKKPGWQFYQRASIPLALLIASSMSLTMAVHVSAEQETVYETLPKSAGIAPPTVLSSNQSLMRETVERQFVAQVETVEEVEEPVVQQPVVQQPSTWWVTEDETSDVRGNACTIFNFISTQWDDAYTWLQENYAEGWPFGRVKSTRPPIELGPTIAIAIVANAMRESSCIPNTKQGVGPISSSLSSSEAVSNLMALGTSSGCAFGIIQWDGDRRENFLRFCNASGLDPRQLEPQLYYMAYEYYASSEYSNYSSLVATYASSELTLRNAESAAEVFRKKVERGGSAYSSTPILETWGNKRHADWGAKPSGGVFSYFTNYMSTLVVAR